ncbi:hypothetical protein AVEN_98149-1 [Araneus ventricosus]|uniref:Transmembrane and TPR repeat-containing protein 3 n=1 Tax=Araneus ventricosus TaxID=182803 RepID=A0A4Y2MNR9_ARAVE|nr:hypothetical protein AVEN_98149-1 [Araneus ventricosus]
MEKSRSTLSHRILLNWSLSGGVFSFHATNVALHSVAVILLLYFCREMLAWRRDASLVAALMFAAHPAHTEAVSEPFFYHFKVL